MAQDPRALLQKAEKTLESASKGFSFFGGRGDKYEAAADLFVEAGNFFKLQKLEREAGQALERAAEIHTNKLNQPDDAAMLLVDAFKAYRKVDPEAAVRCLDVAINRYCAKGNFRRAASQKEIEGDLFENELRDIRRALESFEMAAGWYESDNAPALANKLWLKVADLAALGGDYYKAIELYEKAAQVAANNNLLRYSVKEYLFKAGLCYLATRDIVATQRSLQTYCGLYPDFQKQREYTLLVDLLTAMDNKDLGEFLDKQSAYEQMSSFDKWKADILAKVRNLMQEAAEDEDNEFA